MPIVDAVIVSYNSAADLPRVVSSLHAQAGVEMTVTVVDNASHDDSVTVARSLDVRVIANPTNRGFAAAVNQGARAGQGSWLLVLNPDATLGSHAVASLATRAGQWDRAGVIGPRVVDEQHREYPSGRRFPSPVTAGIHALFGTVAPGNPATRRYHARDLDRRSTITVDWVSGCCFLVPRAVWDELDGLDEAYFMYIEDMDFCLRVARAGYQVLYEPSVDVTHIGGRSSRTRRLRSIYHHHIGAARLQWRLSRGSTRLLTFPVAALFLAARATALTVMQALHQRPGRRASPSPGAGRR